MIYIFDVEGTLSQAAWREHLIPDWEAFHSKFPLDKPYPPINMMLHHLVAAKQVTHGVEVYILTGMMEKHRPMLRAWLCHNSVEIPNENILMRPDYDLRKSPDYKLATIESIFIKNVDDRKDIFVFDDRDDIIFALREAGIACAKIVQN